MYNIGDLMIYSAHGICRVDDICEKTISGITRMYYILHPIEDNHQLTISTPIDNDKVVMLDLIKQDEALNILSSFKKPGIKWNDKPNVRVNLFKDIVNTGDRKEIAKVVNTLWRKKLESEQNDKKLYEQDQKLLNAVQKILFKELSLSLDKSAEEIEELVKEMIKASR
ncbi:CarD family transcriptional regulator [Cytobacillus firmus]|uniref:CarD family transcriptional regulator n=1 Tax=Cytobacillus firmus TaxID=1399 RepID=UPI002161BF65|nr:CarD family transcriptional regulator [Cytobacillus firmus]MCS0673682.1 CarD family transcriptional regulator [Cytobacillus firmus]